MAKSPKIRRIKKEMQAGLKKAESALKRAGSKSDSLRWNTKAGTVAIRKEEQLAGRVAVLEELLEWCERENVPDLD